MSQAIVIAAPTRTPIGSFGGGLADLCYASDDAMFGLPEIRLGLFAPPASVLLPRIIGERRALEWLRSGESVTAAEAERAGLVNRAFPARRLENEVQARLERLVALSGEALRQAKHAVRAARGLPASEGQRRVRDQYVDRLMRTRDASEGLEAFLNKRAPRWNHD